MADDNWKPNGRPQSTIALNFSHDLDNTFGMSNTDAGLDGLARAVEQKKQTVNSQSAELEALNARLKETEERLQRKSDNNNGGDHAGARPEASSSSTPRKTFSPSSSVQQPKQESITSSTMNYWRGGGGGGGGGVAPSEATEGGPPTPSEKVRDMPGGFDGV